MEKSYINNILKKLGFKSSKKDIFVKKYGSANYSISADLKNNKIDFGNKIILGDKTTSNFTNPENLVVLECVNRLLEKGYKPEHLHLEKKWKLGHKGKGGKADINVYDNDEKTILIIECKTAGHEYEKEIQKMEANGGQLFSYLQQDRDAKYLCLYASGLNDDNEIKYENAIVKIEDRPEDIEQYEGGDKTIKLYQKSKNNEQLYNAWKETFNLYFHYNGIFDNDVSAYSIDLKPLKRRDLKELESSQGIFNKFAEILRHNNISDKSNAFNKVLSLFLCKVVDEEKGDGDEERVLDFQVIEGEDTEVLIDKLQALYQEGMDKYLNEDIVYYSDDAVSKILQNFPRQTAQKDILDIFKQVKYYTNQEFAFKEIHNKELFKQNSRILKEVIKLFQYYKFRYTHKEQILGNFFELLLSLGVKQSEGQFFTPVPITRFIVTSIPIKETVLDNLENKVDDFLPKVLDYACGSGHFLTEAIDEIQQVVDNLDDTKYYSKVNEFIRHNKFKTFWAADNIFGIEKDYRLARTSQIACLLNGDGEANIIFGDGLDTPETHRKKAPNFPDKVDVIIANPPYSVKAFKNYLNVNEKDFTLFNEFTENSKEIETLFIEQTKKMLDVCGVASIILPKSILSGTGIYSKAREIILKHFEIPAIVELGGKTFIATSTNTIILFLKRRHDNFQKNRHYIAEDFIFSKDKKRKMDFIDSQVLLKKFAEYRELKVEDYKALLDRKPNNKIKNWDLYKYYTEWFEKLTEIKKVKTNSNFKKLDKNKQQEKLDDLFYEKVFEKEYEKFKYFMLTMQSHEINYHQNLYKSQRTVIIKTGDKDVEKAFLGYEKSERNGYQGIDFDPEKTKLFNDNDFLDITKANSYIRKVLLGQEISEIDETLKEHIKVVNLTDCLTFDNVEFEKSINTNASNKIDYRDIWNDYPSLLYLNDIAIIDKGTSITKNDVIEGNIPVVAGGQNLAYYHNSYNREGEIITVSASGAYAGFLNYWKEKIFASDCNTIKSINEAKISTKLIYEFLKKIQFEIYKFQQGQAQPHVYAKDLAKIKIPIPPINIQKQIVKEIEVIEKKENSGNSKIDILLDKKEKLFEESTRKGQPKKLENICDMKAGQFVSSSDISSAKANDTYPCFGGNGQRGYTKTFTHEGKYPLVGRQGALCGNVHFVEGKFHATEHALVVTPIGDVNIDWLYYLLISMNLNQYATGTAQPGLSVKNIKPIFVNVPKLSEQKKTVVEMQKIEKEIKKLQTSIANVEEEKKTVFTKYIE